MCQKLWKLAGSRQSYYKNYQAYFFWPTLYICYRILYLRPTSMCLCEIIPPVLLNYRIGVHWSVAHVCPRLQRTSAAPDCVHRECPSRAVTHVCVLTAIFTRSVYCYHYRLRWRWIMITAVIEWLRDYLSALTMRPDCRFFLILVTYMTDNSLQSADKDQQEMRAAAEKPRDSVVKFDRSKFTAASRGLPCDSAAFVLQCVFWLNDTSDSKSVWRDK